jgi:hypothetical protein
MDFQILAWAEIKKPAYIFILYQAAQNNNGQNLATDVLRG